MVTGLFSKVVTKAFEHDIDYEGWDWWLWQTSDLEANRYRYWRVGLATTYTHWGLGVETEWQQEHRHGLWPAFVVGTVSFGPWSIYFHREWGAL